MRGAGCGHLHERLQMTQQNQDAEDVRRQELAEAIARLMAWRYSFMDKHKTLKIRHTSASMNYDRGLRNVD